MMSLFNPDPSITHGCIGQVFGGVQIYVNDRTIGEHVKRTWKERLFSWPWCPWLALRFDPTAGPKLIPDGQVILIKINQAWIMNSTTFEALRAEVENRNKWRPYAR